MKPRFILLLLLSACWSNASFAAEVEKTADELMTPKTKAAIAKGLRFLAGRQVESGRDKGAFGATSYAGSVGICGLAGLALMADGNTPGVGMYGKHVENAVGFIVRNTNNSGYIAKPGNEVGNMYCHGFAMLFLAQASGMSLNSDLDGKIQDAINLLVAAQNNQGGWRYHPNSRDSDTSCSGWALMALRSAKLNGADVPDKAIEDAVAYLFKNFSPQGGHFGYSSPHNQKNSLTGMGLLCLELCGRHGSPETVKAADYIMQNFRALEGDQFEFYGNYYNAQAMFQIGGKYWETYADWMYETYLKKQNPGGSWNSKEAGEVYGTAMMTLAFTVPYRQLPIYQRDETVDEE